MFKFKGRSSEDMQVVIEEEEHFIARASQRYEMTEIEGRDGAIFDTLGYSIVERPIYVQCLNINKIDDILAWLNGEGEFEYKGRKTIARFYSQLEPQRTSCIRIIDTMFIRDPFWTKVEDDYETLNESRIGIVNGEEITIEDASPVNGKLSVIGKTEQATRSGKNLVNVFETPTTDTNFSLPELTISNDGFVSYKNTSGYRIAFFNTFEVEPNTNYYSYLEILEETTSCLVYIRELDENMENIKVTYPKNSIFTTSGNTKYIKYGLTTQAYTTTGSFTVRPMIVKSNIADTEYELYGVSPSPNYPSPIRNVGDNINLFDKSKAGTLGYYNSSKVFATSTVYNYFEFVPEHNKDYTIKTTNKFSTNVYFVGFDSEGNTTLITNFLSNEVTFNSSNYVKIGYSVHSDDFDNCKLEQGSTATPYTQYGCGSVDFKVENKNKLPNTATSQTQAGVTFTINEDGLVIANGTATGNINFYINESFPLLAGDYILSGCPAGGSSTTYRLVAPNVINLGGDTSFSLSEDKSNFNAYINIKSGVTVNNLVFKPMLRKANIEDDAYIQHQEQIKSFKFAEGQVLHEGDYLADDGIHQVKGTLVLTGTETWTEFRTWGDYYRVYTTLSDAKVSSSSERSGILCSHFIFTSNGVSGTANTRDGIFCQYRNSQNFYFVTSQTNLANWKSYLATQYANGTPMTIEYELAEEIVIPYTEEQKEAYYQLQHLLMYEGYTNITCIDEIKPDMQLEYEKQLEISINNDGNIESRPILKINKTKKESIDLTVNNIRFKYNFLEDEDYVEIDCEGKTTLYEGLNRNRQLEIDYEFPKMFVGENKIKFNKGDAILEIKRKDRWL